MKDRGVCLSDQVLLHLRNAFDNMPVREGRLAESTKNKAQEMAKALRTNPVFMNGKRPSGVAAGIIYIACVMSYPEEEDWVLTQIDIGKFFGLSGGAIRKYYKAVKLELKM